MSDKTEKLKAIRDAVWNLTESPLYEYRKQNNYYPVLGMGSHDASIMFIGEAPGKNEAEKGLPFVGASGKFLDKMLEGINLKREDVYITNIVKDRPPDNRDPSTAEINLYSPFLVQQIEIIQPKVVATLGRFSMEFILRLFDSPEKIQKISQLHGKVIEVQAGYGKIHVLPLFHPAVALYNQSQKATLLEHFQVL
ncbi:MAG: uracil-DNA glycosylase, partial [Anaerolineae bacterium]|nr:uracil-DNA glycosylase [Anaerolineae bacterium]